MLCEGERIREPQAQLDELLSLADVVALSEGYARARAALEGSGDTAACEARALAWMASALPRARWISQSRGAQGALLIERADGEAGVDEAAVESMVTALIDADAPLPRAGELAVAECPDTDTRVWLAPAELLSADELVDTTGAGDAFNGALAYSLARGYAPECALPLATHVAARACGALGARAALPRAPCVAIG